MDELLQDVEEDEDAGADELLEYAGAEELLEYAGADELEL